MQIETVDINGLLTNTVICNNSFTHRSKIPSFTQILFNCVSRFVLTSLCLITRNQKMQAVMVMVLAVHRYMHILVSKKKKKIPLLNFLRLKKKSREELTLYLFQETRNVKLLLYYFISSIQLSSVLMGPVFVVKKYHHMIYIYIYFILTEVLFQIINFFISTQAMDGSWIRL